MNKYNIFTLLFILGLINFNGCGNITSSENNNNTNTKVSGTAVDDLMANAIITIHKNSMNGEILTTTRTDNNGTYHLSINNYSGPIIVEASCDNDSIFIDNNGTKSKCNLTQSLWSAGIANGNNIKINITPITTQLVFSAIQNSSKITSENLQKAKKFISYIYNIDPITSNPQTNYNYKTILDELHKISKDKNITIEKITAILINDAENNTFGENNITKELLQNLKENIQSVGLEQNKTSININKVKNDEINHTLPKNNIYIWSKEFNSTSNNEIIKTLKNNHIDTAIISFHRSQTDKFKDILDKGIKIIPVIADNNVTYPKYRNKLDEKIKFLSQFSDEIHLDVEPHAIKELENNRTSYFKLYVQMLKYLKETYPDIKIDISIPAFYYQIPNLSNYVNRIYVMAYENPKSLITRISRFPKSVFISQNCKEFNSTKSFNDIVTIIKQEGYENIGFNSYQTCKRFLNDK